MDEHFLGNFSFFLHSCSSFLNSCTSSTNEVCREHSCMELCLSPRNIASDGVRFSYKSTQTFLTAPSLLAKFCKAWRVWFPPSTSTNGNPSSCILSILALFSEHTFPIRTENSWGVSNSCFSKFFTWSGSSSRTFLWNGGSIKLLTGTSTFRPANRKTIT